MPRSPAPGTLAGRLQRRGNVLSFNGRAESEFVKHGAIEIRELWRS